MPHEQMNERQVADYLHMDLRELVKLASRGAVPCRKTAKGFVFRKSDVDHWVEIQMHQMPRQRLAHIEKGVSRHHGFDHEAMLVAPMIPPGGVGAPLHARTRNSVLRELIDLADRAGMVYARDELLEEVRQREVLCSTALVPGVAMPHPRHPLPYDIAASFVVVGLTHGGVPFGAVDGSLTRLFFLICCKDDRTHLHVLSRLAQMLHESTTGVSPVEQLAQASDPDELREILLKLEEHALEKK
jgi:PTS system nitrogen regulatory IIA component